MERKTVVSILARMQNLQDQLTAARIEMEQLNMFHKEIRSICETFTFQSEATQLAESIRDRDFPLTRSEILSIFESSGFAYNTPEHIDMSQPDTDESTKAYRNEMAADYASVFGNDSKGDE